ncbi:TIGR03899 family protein [Vibrio rotiferianus]|uniref:TIGR03899 family protein n=1 Tax=Vibrio rotiferianus TaxID=190895 RepID=UPI001110C138|nr:TIGR03899 family protein [Vibrio rotiferianus]TMX73099.1 TIGR03899 family protein [Vibrio rotiferianus]
MEDLAGIGKSVNKVLDVIAKGTGVLYEPMKIRRLAEAEAYKIGLIAEAEEKKNKLEFETKLQQQLIVVKAKESLKERAEQRQQHKELVKQKNIENIFAMAALSVSESVSDEPVDPDWLNHFIENAESVSSETMQKLWAKVFAKEVENPGKFSLKSLSFLKSITKYEANAFATLCQYASRSSDNEYVILSGGRNNGTFSGFFGDFDMSLFPSKSKLELTQWMMLQKLGLVHENDLFYTSLSKGDVLTFNDYKLTVLKNKHSPLFYCFTPLGNELAQLVDSKLDKEYFNLIKAKFKSMYSLEYFN